MSGCCCNSSVSLTSVLTQLSEILDQLVILNDGLGLGASTTSPVVPITMARLDGAIVGAATDYTTAVFSDTHPKRFILIENLTDGKVLVSLDASHDHFLLTAGSSLRLDFGSSGRTHSTNVGVKGDSGEPPSLGEVAISAYY